MREVCSPGAVLRRLKNTLGDGIIPGLDELAGGRRGWPRGERHRRDGSHQRPTLRLGKSALVWPQEHGALYGHEIASTVEDGILTTRPALCVIEISGGEKLAPELAPDGKGRAGFSGDESPGKAQETLENRAQRPRRGEGGSRYNGSENRFPLFRITLYAAAPAKSGTASRNTR